VGYRLPTFNLVVNIWRSTSLVANPPDIVSAANLTFGERTSMMIVGWATTTSAQLRSAFAHVLALNQILLPKGTDVRPPDALAAPLEGDAIECPAGSGRFYITMTVDDIGRGFPNEHRCAVVVRATQAAIDSTTNPWGLPLCPYPLP
jgi:hypothetical protein